MTAQRSIGSASDKHETRDVPIESATCVLSTAGVNVASGRSFTAVDFTSGIGHNLATFYFVSFNPLVHSVSCTGRYFSSDRSEKIYALIGRLEQW